MLSSSSTAESERPSSKEKFHSLDASQRREVGKMLSKVMKLQQVSQGFLLEAWADAGLTNSISRNSITIYLKKPKWAKVEVTCKILQLPEQSLMECLHLPEIQRPLALVKAIKDPKIQLTMLVNGWRIFIFNKLRS